jgi:hypothetical protein
MDYEEFFTDLYKNDVQEVLEGELDYVHMCKTTGENQYIPDNYWDGYTTAIQRIAKELDIELPRRC